MAAEPYLASAKANYEAEQAYRKKAVSFLQRARDAQRAFWGRAVAYEAALSLFRKARDAAKAVYALTATALSQSDYVAWQALQDSPNYSQAAATKRVDDYDKDLALVGAEKDKLFADQAGSGDETPPPPPPGDDGDLGGAYPDDPAAPPPDPQTQLGLVAAAALVLYAGWELLRRAAGNRRRA